MLRRELTFRCDRDLTLPDARRLYRLASRLHARIQVRLCNLTRSRHTEVCEPLSLMALGCRAGDLCQLLLSGKDAELACIVFTTWVNEQGTRLGGRHPDFTAAQSQLQRQAPALRFDAGMLGVLAPDSDAASALRQLVALLPEIGDGDALYQQLLAREAIASTMLCAGIAMPHAISPVVTQPMLALLHCPSPLEWGSASGPAHLLILMVLPAPPTQEQLLPLQRLVRRLMDPLLQHALLNDKQPAARHALLTLALSQPAD